MPEVIQCITFDKNVWKLKDAKTWLSLHEFKRSSASADGCYKFKQAAPNSAREYVTYNPYPGAGITYICMR